MCASWPREAEVADRGSANLFGDDRPSPGQILCLRSVIDDSELLAGLKRRDRRAAAVFYDRFGPLIDRLVWVLLGADKEHEDIVQEVSSQLLAGVSRVREASALEGWVRMVTVNTVRSQLRRRIVRRKYYGETPDLEGHPASLPDPAARSLVREVYGLLEHLSPELQVVFSLRYVEGYELTEIAAACACSLSTAKRRLKKSRARFLALAERHPELQALIGDNPTSKEDL